MRIKFIQKIIDKLRHKKNKDNVTHYIENIIDFIFSRTNNQDELYCFKNDYCIAVISKNFFQINKDILNDILINNLRIDTGNNKFYILEKESFLYKEHINRISDEELFWKYTEKYNALSCSVIYKSKTTNEIMLKKKWLGEENAIVKGNARCLFPKDTLPVPKHFKFNNSKPRKYIIGKSLKSILYNSNYNEQLDILNKFFEWLFTEYQDKENSSMVSGYVRDCNLGNFIYDGKNFHFIDDETIIDIPIEKSWCIYCCLYRPEHRCLHEYFLNKYNLTEFIHNDKTNSNYQNKVVEQQRIELNNELITSYIINPDLNGLRIF